MLYVSELFESEIAMLISAECYYDLYIKGKEKEVIVGEISTLRNEMARLKQKLESPYYEYEEHPFPGERSQLCACREYLSMARAELLSFGEDCYSEEELACERMLERLDGLTSLTLEMTGETYGVTFEGERAVLGKHSVGGEKRLTFDRAELILGLKSLYIGEWRSQYLPRDYGCVEPSPKPWELRLCFEGGDVAVYSGISVYPYNFSSLLDILSGES